MNSIDAFLVLKEDENKNGFLLFASHLLFLYDKTLNKEPDYKSDSFIIFCHLLQFATGARSRPTQDDVLKSLFNDFIKHIKDNEDAFYLNTKKSLLTKKEQNSMEQIAFLHKCALTQSKILLDTSLPKKDWSLKTARKLNGCACCTPEEDEKEEETNDNKANPFALPGIGSITHMINNSPKKAIMKMIGIMLILLRKDQDLNM